MRRISVVARRDLRRWTPRNDDTGARRHLAMSGQPNNAAVTPPFLQHGAAVESLRSFRASILFQVADTRDAAQWVSSTSPHD